MGARASLARAVLLGVLAIGAVYVQSEVKVQADTECWVNGCYFWYGCGDYDECPPPSGTMCSYTCWGCDDGSYGCSPATSQ